MHFSPFALNILFALLAKHATASFEEPGQPQEGSLEKRAVCTTDGLLKALIQNSASATPFCVNFGHIPIPTVTLPVNKVTPTVTTTTTYLYKSYYPDGRYLESIALPPYITGYAATRVSSACSCLVTSDTSTVTASPTMTTTTTLTFTESLTGPCATKPTHVGAYSVTQAAPSETILNRGPYDPYQCCNNCLIQALGGCVAWANVPGVSCTLLEGPTIYRGERCPNGPLHGAIFQNVAKYPDGLGGSGPCAGTVDVIKT